MEKGKRRGIADPLGIDELKGYDGILDRFDSGLKKADIINLMFKRSRFMIVFLGAMFLGLPVIFLPMDPMLFLFTFGFLFIFFVIIVGVVLLSLLCSCKNMTKTMTGSNYILMLKDKLVVQSKSDFTTVILRNEIPRSKIENIRRPSSTYWKERKKATNPCTRFLTGVLFPPIGGFYPVASRKEYLLIVRLKEPHEVHCCGPYPQGIVQLGDRREYVKEIVLSVAPSQQGRFKAYMK